MIEHLRRAVFVQQQRIDRLRTKMYRVFAVRLIIHIVFLDKFKNICYANISIIRGGITTKGRNTNFGIKTHVG